MLDKGRISSVQLLLLLFMAEMSTTYLFIPSIIAEEAGPDGWISVMFLATIYAAAVALCGVNLAKRFPDQVFTEYLPKIIGLVPGKLLAAAYTIVFIHLTSVVVSEGSIFIHTAFLRETPLLVIETIIVVIAVYGVYLGIEVIARQSELVFPFFILSIALLIALVANEMELHHLQPMLAHGFLPVVKGSLVPAAWRGEVFLILMLFPYLNQKNEALKSSLGMVFIAGAFGVIVFVSTISVFGDLVTSRLIFPLHGLARYISVARILERMELYLIVFWIAGVIVKLAIFFHASSIAVASTLGLRDYRWGIIPVAAAAITLSQVLYSKDYLNLIGFLSRVWPFYGYTVELVIPGLILIVALVRKRGGGLSAAQKDI